MIGVAGYFAYINASNSQLETISTEATASPVPSPSIPTGWAKFTHPTAKYSLIYPKDWKGGLGPIGGVADTPKEFEDFYIESLDHKVVTQGVPALEQGAELYVTTSRTSEKSIDDVYNSNQLSATVNRNKTSTKIDGQSAIQYDYTYEQITATETIFMKDGVLYRATFRYVDENGKKALWDNYAKLLASFKLK